MYADAHVLIGLNAYHGRPRDSASRYQHDALALTLAKSLVDDNRAEKELSPIERLFVYLPYLHAEDIVRQEEGGKLLDELAIEDANTSFFGGVFPRMAAAANANAAVLKQFGRFPERNKALARMSTPEERLYLDGIGSVELD